MWIVATKDFSVFLSKKNIIYSLVLFPLLASLGLPVVVNFAEYARHGGIHASALPGLLNSFAFFFIVGAVTLPTAIASYSLVGEKVEKSLEPLLATPTSDGEILLGKSLAAFLPPILAIYAGATIFMILMDEVTRSRLGYLYFPNWIIGTIMLLVVPLASVLCVESNIIISSRVNDVRAAQQLGGLVLIPIASLYVAAEINIVHLDLANLLVISAVLGMLDLILLYFSTHTFRREDILTKWK